MIAPRFRLVTWLWGTALFAVLLAVLRWTPGYVIFPIVFGLITILAHVAGNAIGTALRDGAARRDGADDPGPAHPSHASPRIPTTPATRLSFRTGLSWFMIGCSITGAVLGGTGGGWALAEFNRDQLTRGSLVLAIASTTVLGGLFGFWMSSFLQVAVQALLQAQRD